jgi:hypothetical protein
MLPYIVSFLSGIYVGGGVIISVVTETIDGHTATWKESAFLALCWPYVLLTAEDNYEE